MCVVTREPARNTRRAGHCRFVNKAPQPLNTKRGCYGQPFSGSHGGSQKMTAVASRPHASTGIGRPAAILVNNMVFYELRSSPMTILVSIWRSGRLRLFFLTILSRLCHHFQLKSGDVPRREEMPDQVGHDDLGAGHDVFGNRV